MAYNDVRSKTDAIEILLNEYFMIRPPKLKIVGDNKVDGE